MKKILIAATTVGVAIASIILYNRKRANGQRQVKDAANNAYDIMNDGIGKIERNAMHSMG